MLTAIGVHLQAYLTSGGSDDDGGSGLVFLLLFAGPAFYGLMYSRYRNQGKRHQFESETKAEMANIAANDSFAESRRRLQNKMMKGANNHDVRGALNQARGGIMGAAVGGLQRVAAQVQSKAGSQHQPPPGGQQPR